MFHDARVAVDYFMLAYGLLEALKNDEVHVKAAYRSEAYKRARSPSDKEDVAELQGVH